MLTTDDILFETVDDASSSNGINFGSVVLVLFPNGSPSGSPGLSGKNDRIKSACKTVFSRSS